MTPIKEIIEILSEKHCKFLDKRLGDNFYSFKSGAEWAITDMAECMEWASKEGYRYFTNNYNEWKWYVSSDPLVSITTTELITMFLNEKYNTNEEIG